MKTANATPQMRKTMKSKTATRKVLALGTGILLAAASAQAAGTAQLGILDTSTINPTTGVEWQVGDKYHLLFVTTTTTAATSTDIAVYNAFVQADANAQTGDFARMGEVSWFALGSTTTTNAINNVIITAPVMNAWNSAAIATNAADMWDFRYTQSRTDTAGNLRNVWTGSAGGGVADGGDQLGATDGTTRRHWSGWTD